MKFPTPLLSGRLIARYKRFLADVLLDDGQTVTAHCANPGSMMGLKTPGARVWLSVARNPARKLKFDLQLVEADDTLVAINTQNPNRLVEEAILDGTIAELAGYRDLSREVAYGANSRVDFLLTDPARPACYVEVKNVHLSRKRGLIEFPDSVTARGAKHLRELASEVAAGHRAVMVYLVQRGDGTRFCLAGDLDPAYKAAFAAARACGVEALAYQCTVTTEAIVVARPIAMVEGDEPA